MKNVHSSISQVQWPNGVSRIGSHPGTNIASSRRTTESGAPCTTPTVSPSSLRNRVVAFKNPAFQIFLRKSRQLPTVPVNVFPAWCALRTVLRLKHCIDVHLMTGRIDLC
jgi:hypothetical protein